MAEKKTSSDAELSDARKRYLMLLARNFSEWQQPAKGNNVEVNPVRDDRPSGISGHFTIDHGNISAEIEYEKKIVECIRKKIVKLKEKQPYAGMSMKGSCCDDIKDDISLLKKRLEKLNMESRNQAALHDAAPFEKDIDDFRRFISRFK